MHVLSIAADIQIQIDKNNENYYLLAIDLRKAFDTVSHKKLINLMEEKKFP